jgi:hypothetical protein
MPVKASEMNTRRLVREIVLRVTQVLKLRRLVDRPFLTPLAKGYDIRPSTAHHKFNICVIAPINRKLRTKTVCRILPGLHTCCHPKPGDQQVFLEGLHGEY